MVQESLSNSYDLYKADALECVNLHLVSSIDEVDDSKEGFKPLFAHQVFGEEETIFGYRDLAVHLFYTAGSLECFVKVNHSAILKEKTASDVKADANPLDTLKPNFEKPLVSTSNEFIAEVQKDESFKPFGNLLFEYSSRNENEDRKFALFKCTTETPNFLEYHKKMQTFLTWLIDGSSFIDVDDPKWIFYVLYEKREIEGKTRWAFVGYSTVYLFYSHPDSNRARISQFLILPPFGRKGHGSRLLRGVYDDLRVTSDVRDITVEDPSDDFIALRDFVDCRYLIESFPPMMKSERDLKKFDEQLITKCLNDTKINKTQLKHLYEILLYYFLDTKSKKKLDAYKNALKRRIRKSLEKPKTKLSEYATTVEEGEDAENGAVGAEYKEQQVDDIFYRTLEHYMTVVNKLQIVL